MIITKSGFTISDVAVDTIFGISGGGIFPLSLLPEYSSLLKIARENNTTIFGKSFTYPKRVGNFIIWLPWTWKYIQSIGKDGMLNAYGLTNGGARREIPAMKNSVEKYNRFIPNYFPDFSKNEDELWDETDKTISLLIYWLRKDFHALIFNLSCPNTKEDISKIMNVSLRLIGRVCQKYPQLTIICKLSCVQPFEMAEELDKLGVVFQAINTVPYNLVYNDESPLAHVGGGGVSGGPIIDFSLDFNRNLRKRVKGKIIMGGGITSLEDCSRFWEIGADVLVICTTVRRNPKKAQAIMLHGGKR